MSKSAPNTCPGARPDEVAERLIAAADKTGANTLLLCLNRGAMPHEMFLEQIRRVGREAMPRLQAHEVRRGPIVEAVEPLVE